MKNWEFKWLSLNESPFTPVCTIRWPVLMLPRLFAHSAPDIARTWKSLWTVLDQKRRLQKFCVGAILYIWMKIIILELHHKMPNKTNSSFQTILYDSTLIELSIFNTCYWMISTLYAKTLAGQCPPVANIGRSLVLTLCKLVLFVCLFPACSSGDLWHQEHLLWISAQYHLCQLGC